MDGLALALGAVIGIVLVATALVLGVRLEESARRRKTSWLPPPSGKIDLGESQGWGPGEGGHHH